MEWIIRLEARTGGADVRTVELITLSRDKTTSVVDVGLTLAEAKSLLVSLQDVMVRGQVNEYVRLRRVCGL